MRTYHVAYVWSWPDGKRYWQASTELDCLSPDAVYYTIVRAGNKPQAIEHGRRTYHEGESSYETRERESTYEAKG
jgi:hypothetical protein